MYGEKCFQLQSMSNSSLLYDNMCPSKFCCLTSIIFDLINSKLKIQHANIASFDDDIPSISTIRFETMA